MRRACMIWAMAILSAGALARGQNAATTYVQDSAPTTSFASTATASTQPSAYEKFVPLFSGGDPSERATRAATLKAWHERTTVDAYNAVGDHNPKWDDRAVAALRLQAECNNPVLGTGKYEEFHNAMLDAVNNGCNDPLILYFLAGYEHFMKSRPPAEVADMYSKAANEMLKRDYPPVRKIAVLMYGSAIKMGKTATMDEANTLLDAALAAAPALAADKDTPIRTVIDQFSELATLEARRSGDLKQASDKILGILAQARPQSAAYYVVQARAMIDQARLASDAQRKQLLADAIAACEKGYAADPSDPNAAVQMLMLLPQVPDGHAQADHWLERALKADPDNYYAAQLYLEALYPRSGGEPRAMVDFGRACLKGGNFHGGLPLILVAAHEELAHYTPRGYSLQQSPAWFTQPPVYQDIRSVYEPLLRADPSNSYQRSRYVMFACFASDWKTAKANMDAMGDNFSRRVFGGAEYKKLRELVGSVADAGPTSGPTTAPATAPVLAPATAPSAAPVQMP